MRGAGASVRSVSSKIMFAACRGPGMRTRRNLRLPNGEVSTGRCGSCRHYVCGDCDEGWSVFMWVCVHYEPLFDEESVCEPVGT